MAFIDILNKHNDHKVVILPRFHKGKPTLVPGLYCEDCAKLIKWLTPKDAQELVSFGVEKLDPIKSDKMKLFKQQLEYDTTYNHGGWK